MTNIERATLLGDELTQLLEAYSREPNARTLGDCSAALINRCASMAVAAVVNLHEWVEKLEADDGA